MSAFFDIWFGDTPLYKRKNNKEWEEKRDNNIAFWSSAPENYKLNFFSEEDTPAHKLIVIGQFYEDVALPVLLQSCINYAQNKTSQFVDPAGHYILFLLDKESTHVHVFTNRFGTYHAYWSAEKDNNRISTYYLGLAKASVKKELDWYGISGFFSMGFFPEDTTYLTNVKIFQPASYYCFDSNLQMLASKRYWNWEYSESVKSKSEYMGLFNDSLNQSLVFALKDKRTALPISGGLDSRTLAGIISSGTSTYSSLWSYSYGYTESSIENRIAGKVANACVVNHTSYKIPDYLFDSIDDITDSVELFQYVDGTRQAMMKNKLAQDADIVVGGHWGDVWLSDMGVSSEDGKSDADMLLNAFSKKIIKRGSSWLMSEVVEEYYPNAYENIRTYFTDFLNKHRNVKSLDMKFRIFKTDQWSFRWTLPSIRMYQAAIMPVLPFYDKHVVDVCLQLPAESLAGRSFQIEYLKKYHPRLAGITWQEYNSNLHLYKWFNNRNLAYRAMNKLKRSLLNRKGIIRNADLFYLNDDGKQNLTSVLNTNLQGIVPADKINQLLLAYYQNPSAENTYTISMLHTFAQFMRKINE